MTRAKAPKLPKFTVYDFNRLFPNDEACLDFILGSLYPDGVTCRKCGRVTKHHRLNGRKAYSCQECGTHVYPLAGTIFAKSETSLKSWFYAMFIMASTRCGVSAKQLERELGVTYKTAWRMFKQIRLLLSQDPAELFSGEVEADEAYIGGMGKWKHASKRGHEAAFSSKTPVFGMAQRGRDGQAGRVVAQVVEAVSTPSILPRLKTRVLPESMIYTDEGNAFDGVKKQGYQHRRVNHSASVYVDGDVHVNTIEGFWSLVKSGIRGAHHSVSAKYLQAYLDEYAFRYNHRDGDLPMFGAIADQVSSVRYGDYGKYQPID